MSVKTGLSRLECSSLASVFFEEIVNICLKNGVCTTPIGVFKLKYKNGFNSIEFSSNKNTSKRLNEPNKEEQREITFE